MYANAPEKNRELKYPSNYITTTRYNILTFLPKNAWEQLHRLGNLVFLFIAILNFFPIVLAPYPFLPLVLLIVVLSLRAIMDAIMDIQRYIHDRELNSRKVYILSGKNNEIMDRAYDDVQDESIGKCYVDEENCDSLHFAQRHSLKQIEWKDIRVGDVLYIRKNEEVPADVLLLSSSEKRGECFVGLYFFAFFIHCSFEWENKNWEVAGSG